MHLSLVLAWRLFNGDVGEEVDSMDKSEEVDSNETASMSSHASNVLRFLLKDGYAVAVIAEMRVLTPASGLRL